MSSWETEKSKSRGVSDSLRKRAEKRIVEQIASDVWVVEGSKKLSDAYPDYTVTMSGGAPKYECTCYQHGRGDTRRKRMCSHVLAVILYRKNPHQEWVESEPDLEPAGEGPVKLGSGPSPAGGGIVQHPEQFMVGEDSCIVPTPRDDEAAAGGDGTSESRFLSVSAGTLNQIALDPQHKALGKPPLPDKFTEFRDNQWQAILDILEHLESGKKVVMLSAPTGVGKSLIGEVVRRLVPGRKVYTCTTKSLQDQVVRDFPYAKVIKGRANYPTQTRRDLTADDCTATAKNGYECEFCDKIGDCPYRIAKDAAAIAELPVLNIAYYLSETSNYGNSDFINRDLVIIDEADTLENQLMSNIEVVIGPYLRKQIGVYSLPKKTVPGDWVQWLERETMPGMKMRYKRLKAESRTLMGTDPAKARQTKKLGRLFDRIKPLIANSGNGTRPLENGWVMTGYEGSKDSDATIRFKPIKVNEHAHNALWSRGGQFLLMSATLISPAQMAEDLGLEEDDWAVVSLESTFPVENRPVFIQDVGAVTHKTKATTYPKIVKALDGIAKDNPGVRILVHTVSYALTKHITDNIITSRAMTYKNAKDRERVLAEFLSTDDAILLAPSFDRGIDLPEEDCEIIVIAKCVDEDTMIATPFGLKRHDEVDVGDIVYGLTPEGEMIEQPVERMFVDNYSGLMLKANGQSLDMLVTPDHRVLTRVTQPKYKNFGGFEYLKASDPRLSNTAYSIPVQPDSWNGIHTDETDVGPTLDIDDGYILAPNPMPSKLLFRLLGWYVAEGYSFGQIGAGKAVVICQNSSDGLNEITDLCDDIGLHYRVTGGRKVVIRGPQFHRFVQKHLPGKAKTKRISQWVRSHSSELLNEFLEGAMAGDGTWRTGGGGAYYTASPGLVEDISDIAIKVGYAPVRRIGKPSPGSFKTDATQYIVSLHKTKNRKLDGRYVSNVDYSGVVWCPTVPTGNFLACRNGSYFFTGNCPYPYLGDKQISARLYARGGQSWYAVQTIRSIVQMTGRGMRSKDDWCDSIILDSSFKRLFRDNKTLFPKWWKESLVLSMTDPKYRPLIKAAKDRKAER